MKILCVDNDVLVLTMLKRFLTSRNYVVELAQSPLIAMRLFTSNNYDLVVTDYDLGPKTITGLRLTGLLKTCRKISVILHTGTYESQLHLDEHRYKPDKVVPKGNIVDLLTAIEEIRARSV
jgi:CheY-like chemotaxis protein